MNQESDPSEKELVKIDDLEKQENRKLEKQENITRKDIPEINKITNKSDSGITSEQSTNKNPPSKKKLSKEITITTPAPTLTVIPTPITIPKPAPTLTFIPPPTAIPKPKPAPTLTFIPPPTAIPTPTVIPTPIPPRNPKLVNTKKFKLIPTHTPTATATPYPEIRIIFGTTIIGIVNEWSLLRGGFIERQNPYIELTAEIIWGDSENEELEELEIEWEGFSLSNMKKGYFKGRHIYTSIGDFKVKIIVKSETAEKFIIEGKALINNYE